MCYADFCDKLSIDQISNVVRSGFFGLGRMTLTTFYSITLQPKMDDCFVVDDRDREREREMGKGNNISKTLRPIRLIMVIIIITIYTNADGCGLM